MTEQHGSLAPPVGVGAANNATGYASIRAHVTARCFPRHLDRQLAVGVVGPAGSALAIHAGRTVVTVRHPPHSGEIREFVSSRQVRVAPARTGTSRPVEPRRISADDRPAPIT